MVLISKYLLCGIRPRAAKHCLLPPSRHCPSHKHPIIFPSLPWKVQEGAPVPVSRLPSHYFTAKSSHSSELCILMQLVFASSNNCIPTVSLPTSSLQAKSDQPAPKVCCPFAPLWTLMASSASLPQPASRPFSVAPLAHPHLLSLLYLLGAPSSHV